MKIVMTAVTAIIAIRYFIASSSHREKEEQDASHLPRSIG